MIEKGKWKKNWPGVTLVEVDDVVVVESPEALAAAWAGGEHRGEFFEYNFV